MKRKGRFAKFSGATTTFIKERIAGIDAQGNEVRVPVGNVSLSKQVVNTGRGPNQERIAEYYARVSKESYEQYLPDAMPLTEPMKEIAKRYAAVVKETPRKNRLTLIQSDFYRLDIFMSGEECYFVEIDYCMETIRRSRTYGSKKYAYDRLNNNRITWSSMLSGG